MLRLSIIVPFLDDHAKLESTLLSLLENRNSDLEILVVHNGNYDDPYDLGADEVVLIQAPTSFGHSESLNLAIATASAPTVQILLPGMRVQKDWYQPALAKLGRENWDAVASPCSVEQTHQVIFGLDRTALPHRRLATRISNQAVPLLAGTLFRKNVLLLIGGLCPQLGREGAEVELQLLMDAMDLQTTIVSEALIQGPQRVVAGMDIGFEMGKICGQIACAYGAVEGSGVEVDSLAKQLGHLAGGLMNPKSVAERLGWVMGIRDRSLESFIRDRLVTAAEKLDEAEEVAMRVHDSKSVRRAA
ncbi:hypothetical protein VN12_02695 [Pirellula sp. SH-Sr6A]|uniref:glycosyltransferase n=1 Tax=Pirellula sp. SH-Sr6A TaxID=1632865 RepID=UPI00078D6B9A|nr:glycosyltransferase [Pirellula sp. SH-Sr6A]AMV30996.1 hypothetical protein VN12_02695 [Pirellula sp. SH-Sr6A]